MVNDGFCTAKAQHLFNKLVICVVQVGVVRAILCHSATLPYPGYATDARYDNDNS